MDGVDIPEQLLLEKYPETLKALLKDHSRTRFENVSNVHFTLVK